MHFDVTKGIITSLEYLIQHFLLKIITEGAGIEFSFINISIYDCLLINL